MTALKQTDQSNPWGTTSSKVVYENNWIKVREDQVVRPDGKPGIYGVVHFKSIATGVIALEGDGRIHLVGQYRYPLQEYSWEIPEGGCPEDEDPLAAAKRELLEETGLTAKNWVELGRGHLSNSVSDEAAVYYLATELTRGEAQPEGTEKLSHQCIPFEEALNMVLRGEITDSVSMLAIMQYALKYRAHLDVLKNNSHK